MEMEYTNEFDVAVAIFSLQFCETFADLEQVSSRSIRSRKIDNLQPRQSIEAVGRVYRVRAEWKARYRLLKRRPHKIWFVFL